MNIRRFESSIRGSSIGDDKLNCDDDGIDFGRSRLENVLRFVGSCATLDKAKRLCRNMSIDDVETTRRYSNAFVPDARDVAASSTKN
jgi:hypothetical protein